jgi:cell division septation protein DedD
MRALVCALLVGVTSGLPLQAQSLRASGDTLALIDSLIAQGNVESARVSLRAWLAAHPAGPTTDGSTRAHTLYLDGILASDWKGAEDAFLAVALTHPTTAHAPLALLRLGQGLVTTARAGDAAAGARAAAYLQRLTTDYPTSPVRPDAFLWLAYSLESSGQSGEACAAATSAVNTARDDAIASIARQAQQRSCGDIPVNMSRAPGGEAFAVQIGAFRAKESADQLASRARAAGFDTRVVTIQGGSIFRVRTGSFPAQTNAQDLAEMLRRAGFDTSIVNDVQFESIAR